MKVRSRKSPLGIPENVAKLTEILLENGYWLVHVNEKRVVDYRYLSNRQAERAEEYATDEQSSDAEG